MEKKFVKYYTCVALNAITAEIRKLRESELDDFYKIKEFLNKHGVYVKVDYNIISESLIMEARLTESESYALSCFEKENSIAMTFEHVI